MTFTAAVARVYRHYANFDGRSSRAEFWSFFAFHLGGMAALAALATAASEPAGTTAWLERGVQFVLAGFVLINALPSLAVSVRRLHDSSRSGWWVLVGLLPIFGWVPYVLLMALPPTQGPNRFGPESATSQKGGGVAQPKPTRSEASYPTFSLEGRPAPGLYLAAWLLSGAGIAVLIVAVQAGPPLGGLLLMAALLAIALGFTLAAGYQVLERRSRPPDAYRGPSPLLAFGAYFVVINAIGVALVALGLRLTDPLGILVLLSVQVVGYFVAVWLFAVRSGALSWHDLDLRRPLTSSRLLGDVLVGAGVMFPATFGILIVTAVVFTALGVQPPEVVPTPPDAGGRLLIGIAVVALVPIGEELFFRGYALTAWLRDLGERAAIIRSALFFALFHIININAATFDEGARQALGVVLVILPVGVIMGILFVKRGLLAAVAAHVTYNGLGYTLGLLAEEILRRQGS